MEVLHRTTSSPPRKNTLTNTALQLGVGGHARPTATSPTPATLAVKSEVDKPTAKTDFAEGKLTVLMRQRQATVNKTTVLLLERWSSKRKQRRVAAGCCCTIFLLIWLIIDVI